MGVESIPGVKEAVSPAQILVCQREGTYASNCAEGILCSAEDAICQYRAGQQCNKWRLKTREEMAQIYSSATAMKDDEQILQ